MKYLFSSVLLSFLVLTSTGLKAADPVWQEGKTDEAYPITVYHSPTCGCCKLWIDHLNEHNFEVKSIEVANVQPIKQRLGVPAQGASCHTAVVNGKVIEGHVPAQDIKRLLASENDIRLLTVPAMPSGTPGMDSPGALKQAFNVFAVSNDNKVEIYNSYSDY